MAIPSNQYQESQQMLMVLLLQQYQDAKTLFEAIQVRFSGNDTTKKTQKTLLKQMYNNFNAPGTVSLDSIFKRLQKFVSQLAILVSVASIPVSTVSSPNNTANLSDPTVYAFLTNQPNGSQLVHEDLEQIHEDYLAEMDLKWQLALLRYDKTKVECFNCHKMGVKYGNLRIELNKSKFDLAKYKRGLASVEEQLVFYNKNEVAFYDEIVILKRDASFRESDIIALNLQLEKLKKEKESNHINIDNFENASKSLDKLIRSQIIDNNKTSLGFTSYNVVVPPPTGLFAPPTIELSSFGLEEFKQPEFESYGPKASKSACVDTLNVIKKVYDALIIEDWVSNYDKDEFEEVVVKSKKVQHKPEQVNQPRKENQNLRNNITN
nr:hypothetical protein [Tanacetum cinerariifolium]